MKGLPNKSEAVDAATRTGVRQLRKLTQEPFTAMLARGLGDDSPEFRAKVARFLNTDVGKAMFAGTMAFGLDTLPLPDSLKTAVPILTRELRVQALTDAGDTVADAIMAPMRQLLVTALADQKIGETLRQIDQGVSQQSLPEGKVVDATFTPDHQGDQAKK
jgi:hypothetical protein